MKRWLLVWLLSAGLAAEPPQPVLVRFDCQPPVERVIHHSNDSQRGSAVSLTDEANVFRFTADEGFYTGDLAAQPSRFELSGHGFTGTARLDLETARQLESRGQAYHVADWRSTSYGAQLTYLGRRYRLLWTLIGLSLLGLTGWFWRRRAQLGCLRLRQRRLDELIRPSSDPMVGTKIGPYRLIDRLGAGGMARVYRAVPDESLDTEKVCALKIVRPERDTPEFRLRFQREIQVTMTLDHPNVIRVLDFGSLEEVDFLATELISGVTLKEKIPPAGLPLFQALSYFLPLLEALEYAHGRGIVHRDLKPDNVMVDERGRVKLMDFGLARNDTVQALTAVGGVMGTPDYMAPEQLGERPEPRALSDQYSAGLILYRLLCGRLPFDDQDTMALIYATVHDLPPPPRRFRRDLSVEVEEIVLRTLAKDPAQRFPDIAALRQALLGLL